MQISEHPVLQVIRHTLTPVVAATMLALLTLLHGIPFTGQYVALAVIIMLLIARFLFDIDLDAHGKVVNYFWFILAIWVFMRWCWILALIGLILYAADLFSLFKTAILLQWAIITPFVLVGFQMVIRFLFFRYYHKPSFFEAAVIVGVNDLSVKLAKTIQQQITGTNITFHFFDDRAVTRLPEPLILPDSMLLVGGLSDVHQFVVRENIKVVYIALSMTEQSRIHFVLEALRDTTVSIYYLPDVFTYDVIQARFFTTEGIPVISLCESPFIGKKALIKRLSDLLLSSVILVLVSPVMLLIALGIKLSSKGPIIFKQLRYGLDGQAIEVYKFRSMTVCENSNHIVQATRNDQRITPLGAFLRKTSLDELPQFINVFQGRMSIVGPRPHAVAHNELYRKKIKGYMIRHKVKPGITGWAQIHGYRGETDTLDKMEARIEYDLDYLRNWSLSLDLIIVFKTLSVIFYDENAY